MSEFSSPLGLLIRGDDKYGTGAFGAPRSRDGAAHPHMGLDIVTVPGQPIILPAPLKCVRVAVPYPEGIDADVLKGILLEAMDGLQLKILYMDPIMKLMGGYWPRGTVIGHAQSLQNRYPGITNHCHFEVWLHSERVDPTPYFMETT